MRPRAPWAWLGQVRNANLRNSSMQKSVWVVGKSVRVWGLKPVTKVFFETVLYSICRKFMSSLIRFDNSLSKGYESSFILMNTAKYFLSYFILTWDLHRTRRVSSWSNSMHFRYLFIIVCRTYICKFTLVITQLSCIMPRDDKIYQVHPDFYIVLWQLSFDYNRNTNYVII